MGLKVNDKEHRVSVNVYADEKKGMYPYVILTDDLSHRIAAQFSFKQDLRESKEVIEFIKVALPKRELSELIISSLFNSAVIKYGRCFSFVNSGRKKKLLKENVFKQAEQKHIKVHQEIIDMRNDFIAHAQKSQYESMVMVAYLLPEAIERKISSVEFASRSYGWNESLIDDFLEIITYAISHVEQVITGLEPAFLKFKETINIDELYSQSMTQPSIFWFYDYPKSQT